jgi:hypothetical protein
MQRGESRPALSVVLALWAGCAAPQSTVARPYGIVVAQAQKEEDTMKTSRKQQSSAAHGGERASSGEGPADAGQRAAVSPEARQAIVLAQSKSDTDHGKLRKLLLDKNWLDQLDPPGTAVGIDPRFLQLTQVLRVTAQNTPATLEGPAGDALYLRSDYRKAALIEASGAATNAGPKLMALWRSQLHPDADELQSTVHALISNQNPEALTLLADVFSSEAIDTDVVIAWFRGPVLEHRQDAELLGCLEGLLEGNRLDPKRSAGLVEAIFDYRPSDWYITTGRPPAPPSRADLTEAARARLRSIADSALRRKLIDSRRRAQIETELGTARSDSDTHGQH